MSVTMPKIESGKNPSFQDVLYIGGFSEGLQNDYYKWLQHTVVIQSVNVKEY